MKRENKHIKNKEQRANNKEKCNWQDKLILLCRKIAALLNPEAPCSIFGTPCLTGQVKNPTRRVTNPTGNGKIDTRVGQFLTGRDKIETGKAKTIQEWGRIQQERSKSSVALCDSFAVDGEEIFNAENAKWAQSSQRRKGSWLTARGSVFTLCPVSAYTETGHLPKGRILGENKTKARSLWLTTRGYKKEISTVQHSKQLVLKKASRNVAFLQHGEAFGFHRSSFRFSGKLSEVELTIRAC
jgi:hypothetical protein